MKYAHIDSKGLIQGWYDNTIHSSIPTPNIEVTESQWKNAINNGHNKANIGGGTEYVDFRTKEEIEKTTYKSKIRDAQTKLSESDYKVLPDYDGNMEGVLEERARLRALIRDLTPKL